MNTGGVLRALAALSLWPLAVCATGDAPEVRTAEARTTTLVFTVTNVRNSRGTVHIDVCPQAKFLKDDCPYKGDAPAVAGTTVVTIAGVPHGTYAAQGFHDENGNHEIDRALFGIPKEGVIFSRDARISFGPPRFADAAIAVGGAQAAFTMRMRYFLGPSGPRTGH